MSATKLSSSQSSSLNQIMMELFQKYKHKTDELLSSQLNYLPMQVQKLQTIFQQNQLHLTSQKKSIDQLAEKINIISVRTESKVALMSKELQNFKKYYDQCYKYTVCRLNDIFDRTNSFSAQIQRQIQLLVAASPVQYIQYANRLILSVIKAFYQKSQDLNSHFYSELFEFELQLGKLQQFIEEGQLIYNELKITKYGNEGLRESLEKSIQLISNLNKNGMEDTTRQKILSYFQPKFKEILKRIHGYSIQTEVVRLMKTIDSKTSNKIQEDQNELLRQKISEIQQALNWEKTQRVEESKKKQQLIEKKNKITFQLEQSLNNLKKKQVLMGQQISQLKLQNLEYSQKISSLYVQMQSMNQQIKLLKIGQKNRTVLAEQDYDEKIQQMQTQHDKLLQKFWAQQELLRQLRLEFQAENSKPAKIPKARGQKMELWKSQCESTEKKKIRQLSVPKSSKEKIKYSNSFIEINMYDDRVNLSEENQRLFRENRDLQKVNKQLQEQIGKFIRAKSNQQQQDQEYQDELESEIQRSSMEILKLSQSNLELFHRNHELSALNEKLTSELQDSQQRLNQYEKTVYQLARQIQTLVEKNQELEAYVKECESNLESPGLKVCLSSKNWSQRMKEIKNSTPPEFKRKEKDNEWRKSRKHSNLLLRLEGAIINTGLPLPICCEVDRNGCIVEQKTGNYLVDRDNNPIRLSEAELDAAQERGLILI